MYDHFVHTVLHKPDELILILCCLDALHHVRCIYHSGRNCCCSGQGIVVAMGKEARRQHVYENMHTAVYMLILF